MNASFVRHSRQVEGSTALGRLTTKDQDIPFLANETRQPGGTPTRITQLRLATLSHSAW